MQINIGPPYCEYQMVTRRFLSMFFMFRHLESIFCLEGSSAKKALSGTLMSTTSG